MQFMVNLRVFKLQIKLTKHRTNNYKKKKKMVKRIRYVLASMTRVTFNFLHSIRCSHFAHTIRC